MEQLLYPDASGLVSGLQAGQQAGMTQRKNSAAVQAGGLMASGDYRGAASALYGAGDIASGSAVAQAGYTQSQEAVKVQRQQDVQAKMQAGDIAGAYQAAGTDPDLMNALDRYSAHLKDTTATMAAALQALKDPATGQWLPPDQARAKYAALKPQLLSRGLDPKVLDGFDPTPDALQGIQSQVLGLDKQLELAKPVVVGKDLVNPQSGKPVYRGPDFQKVGPGETLLNMGGPTGDGSAPTAAAPAAPGPQMTTPEAPIPTGGVYNQVGQIATSKGATPAEVAYLQRLAQVESHGNPTAQNGKSTGVFQFHPDTFTGLGGKDITDVGQQTQAALALQKRDRANLKGLGVEPTDANAYIMHQQGAGGGRALLTAPPEVNAVSVLTPVYGSAKVAEQAIVNNGGTPDMTAGDFTNMWRQRWANGGAPVAHAGAAPAAAAPATPATPGGPQVVYKGAPAWQSDGKGNLVNAATGDRKIDPTYQGERDVDPNIVKMVLDGRYPIPTGRAATDPKWQAVIQAAAAQDPNFNAADFNARNRAYQNATSGKMSRDVTAYNTALSHLDLLNTAIDGLGNTGFPANNAAAHMIAGATGTDARIQKFETAKRTALDEVNKALIGGGGALGDREALMQRMSDAANPATLKAVLGEVADLLEGKINSQRDQYESVMGDHNPIQFLQPAAATTLAKIRGQASPTGGNGAPADGIPVVTAADAAKLPKGTRFRTTDGRVLVRQ